MAGGPGQTTLRARSSESTDERREITFTRSSIDQELIGFSDLYKSLL